MRLISTPSTAMLETYGRYQLVKKIAVGGMGEVWLARQRGMVGFEKLVVVKRLLPHLTAEQEFINMFFDEARIAALLNHPNIAQIYDLGEVNGEYYIAMEYVPGENLRTVAQRALDLKGGMPIALKCRVLADAAAALNFAHLAKSPSGAPLDLIHRDVSPQNIIVGFSGSVKLIDFGVAKAAGKITRTATGVIKGKYAYMSPEQARGHDLDSRSDIFGLGIVFYEILASQRLFKRENDTETLKAIVYGEVAPPSSVVRGIPKQVDAIVMKALAKNRDDRYQTAGDMQLAIEEFLVRGRLPATPAHLSAYMRELFEVESRQDDLDEESESTQSTTGSGDALPQPAPRPARASNVTVNLQELKLRISSCMPGDTVTGFFFNALFGHTLRVAMLEARTFVDALTYPTPEFLRLLWKAVELLAPNSGGVDLAFQDIGTWAMDGLLRSPLGKPIESMKGQTPHALMKAMMATLKPMLAPGDRVVGPFTASSGMLIYKGDVLPVQFHAGLATAALQRLAGLQIKTAWEKTAADRVEMKLTW
jgi:eukaryotic-like serine/threonine-protein kinase